MKINGQLHAPADLPQKRTPAAIEKKFKMVLILFAKN
jgi:hypothetical protein